MELYLKYALMGAGALLLLRALAVSTAIYVTLLPLLYVYGLATCPPMESFDAKKELKRVLRGHHLSDDDAAKPKGTMEQWAARIRATVTAEVVTMPGYEVDMTPLGGAAFWTAVIIPAANVQCYWVGANHRWYYIGSRELNPPPSATGNVPPFAPPPQSAQGRRTHQD